MNKVRAALSILQRCQLNIGSGLLLFGGVRQAFECRRDNLSALQPQLSTAVPQLHCECHTSSWMALAHTHSAVYAMTIDQHTHLALTHARHTSWQMQCCRCLVVSDTWLPCSSWFCRTKLSGLRSLQVSYSLSDRHVALAKRVNALGLGCEVQQAHCTAEGGRGPAPAALLRHARQAGILLPDARFHLA